MATTYTETPDNYNEIESFITSDVKNIKKAFFSADRVLFYDACSFQRHSNLSDREKEYHNKLFQSTWYINLYFQMRIDGGGIRLP